MKRVLVLGGTRFFGKKLVERLIDRGYDVTIATRGMTNDSFGTRVKRIQLDRDKMDSKWDKIKETEWDIVYDNICYASNSMLALMDVLKGHTKKYVFTSTLSVYEQKANIVEQSFDPETYPFVVCDRHDVSYQEGKRQCEAALFQHDFVPSVAVRFPIVLGEDDYTKRLHWHVERVEKGEPIYFPNINAEMSFITADEAADVLLFVGEHEVIGPVNATSTGHMSMRALIKEIEAEAGKTAVIEQTLTNEAHHSPFGADESYYMSNAFLTIEGFEFSRLTDWLPSLIRRIHPVVK